MNIIVADYSLHGDDICKLLSAYARDPMGGGKDLSRDVLDNLPGELGKRPYAFSILCYKDDSPVGLINCFEAFSTFQCKPIINIHDIVVDADCRGQGICQAMLEKVASIARQKGCCKITLEVLEGNTAAQRAYMQFGFAGYQLDPAMGKAMFWEKSLI